MRDDEVVPVMKAVVEALVEAGVVMTAEQVDSFQRALAPRLWPLLDAADQELMIRAGWDSWVAQGRAVVLDDGTFWS
jgi:hypothetical protein